MTSKLQLTVLVTALAAALPVVNAAEQVDVDRVVACANERDPARRLACYDAAVAVSKQPLREQPAPAPAVTSPKPVAPESTAPAELPAPAAATAAPDTGDFGVTGSAVARQRREQEQAQDESGKVASITAEVTAVSSKPHGELVITLDNGQIWMQKRTERRFVVEPGDKITINAGMLGSFRMVNGSRSTQVTRVK